MLVMEQVSNTLVTAGLGVLGRTVFAYSMPETAITGLVALNQLIEQPIDWELGGFNHDSFQVIGRSSDIPTLRLLMSSVSTTLTWAVPRTIAATGAAQAVRVIFCRPRHRLILFPRTPAGLVEGSINFDYAGYPV